MKNITTFLLLILTPYVFAQISTTEHKDIAEHDEAYYEGHSTAHTYTNEDGVTMPYRLFLPPGYDAQKKYPLVLAFHGAGSRGNDNKKQLRPWVAGWMDVEVQSEHPCIILMPQCPKKQQWVNTPWKNGSYELDNVPISEPMTLAKDIFDKVVKENAVNMKRIYVMGVSMGGYGAWNFLMRYHKLIAAAVPVCGAADPSLAKKLKKMPIWAFHGDVDPTVPLSGSTDMTTALKSFKNNKTRLTIYEGVGHKSYEMAWKEAELLEWVFSQEK